MRHHYVPQFLLGAWADTNIDGRVEVFRLDLPGVPSTRRTPKHTAFEDNLYALSREVVAGMEQQAVETNVLRLIDDLAAKVHQKLLLKGLKGLSGDERSDWVRFLMSLRVRQPTIITHLRRDGAKELRRSLAREPEEYEANASPDDPETMEDWTEKHFPGLIENFGLSFFHKLVDDPAIGNKLVRLKWFLWDFRDARHELLIGDHPCIFTAGIDQPNIIVALPISPWKAFFAARGDDAISSLRLARANFLAMRLNESTLGQAQARVYARNKAPDRFIQNRRHVLRANNS